MVYNREEAARRAEASKTNTPGMCQQWTRTMFGAPSVGDVDKDGDADAIDGWLSEPPSKRHTGPAPRGVPGAWRNANRNGNGHRAVSLGNGLWRSTDMKNGRYHKGSVGTATTAQINQAMGLVYLGWSETISGIQIPLPPSQKEKHVPKRPAPVRKELKKLRESRDDLIDYLKTINKKKSPTLHKRIANTLKRTRKNIRTLKKVKPR